MKREIHISGAYIEITSLCNAQCFYCYNHSSASGIEMSFEKFQEVISYIEENTETNNLRITISGGEPLLHSHINKILIYLYNKNYNIKLITNSTLLGERRFKELLNHMEVQLTLESIDAQKHDKVRGKGNFNDIMRGIANLHPKDKTHHLIARINISSYNVNEIEELIVFSRSLNFNEVHFSFLDYNGNQSLSSQPSFYSDPIRAMEIIDLIDDYKEKYNEQDFKIINKCKPKLFCAFTSEKISIQPRITPEGDTYLCEGFISPECSIGNIYKEKLGAIINGSIAEYYIDKIVKRKNDCNGCKDCCWFAICEKGCPGKLFSYFNILDKKPAECLFYKNYFKNKIFSII